jgi:hypothetical protein
MFPQPEKLVSHLPAESSNYAFSGSGKKLESMELHGPFNMKSKSAQFD